MIGDLLNIGDVGKTSDRCGVCVNLTETACCSKVVTANVSQEYRTFTLTILYLIYAVSILYFFFCGSSQILSAVNVLLMLV